MNNRLIRDGVAEFIGTFMLVLIGAGAVAYLKAHQSGNADTVVAALAHGLILVAIVSIYGHISGAHVNPAITLSLLVGRQIDITRAGVYWVAQFAGGLVASWVLRFTFPFASNLGQTVPASGVTTFQVLVLEGLLTFFLASAVYQTAVYGKLGNVAPIAIGFTLAASILFAGPLTGASLNPARTLGPALVTGDLSGLLGYLFGTFGGGAIAGHVHSQFFPASAPTPPPKK
jgi:aquaporin TIP